MSHKNLGVILTKINISLMNTVSFPIIYFRVWKTLIFGTFLHVIRPKEAFKLLQTERTFAQSIAMVNAHIWLHLHSAIDLWKSCYARLKIQSSPLWTAISRRILISKYIDSIPIPPKKSCWIRKSYSPVLNRNIDGDRSQSGNFFFQ